ncbi:aldo/keto reductase [Maritalea porphyrae]|uniref:aldo/keto reductase n=1 Tax=Maritalea porphyrae TaxID=880732 RepID=UPI0022B03106|nr:aldo/keto reductase [Maritalea porphyrae]MCZ4273851.1 aldo/keto reductase [Maritalea porphyrae]
MKFNKLGRTELKVSEICLGTMTWGRQNTEQEAHQQMDYALDREINFFDTAELYAVPTIPESYGLTEQYIGTWFKNSGNRDKVILATKIAGEGVPWIRDGSPINASSIRKAVEDSLKRLQTDYIDLYQLHWPNRGHYHFSNAHDFDPFSQDTQAELSNMLEVLETLDALVRDGKIRHIGLSNESAWGTMQYLRLSEQNDLPRVASIQNEYGLLRRYFDHDLAEVSHHENVGLLAYSALAAGALSGKYLDGQIPKGTRGELSVGATYRNSPQSEPAIRAYMALAKEHGLDVCQMGLKFALDRPFMTSVIIGATNMEQLKTDIDAKDIVLSEDVLEGIKQIYVQYPRPI